MPKPAPPSKPQGKRKASEESPAQPKAKKAKEQHGGEPGPQRGKGGEGAAPKVSAFAKLSKKERKEASKAKKLAVKKNYNIIVDALPLWEKLRPKDVPASEKQPLVSEILKKAKGKLVELSNHHTASRIIQFCAKHGNAEERKAIMEEVKSHVIPLAKSKYGHHLVMKLINSSSKEDVAGMVKLFRGHLAELLRQSQGADVVDDLYNVASTSQRNLMCAEFYGKEFTLFDGVSHEASKLTSLKQLFKGASGTKRRSVLQHMSRALIPIMEKAILHPAMTHRLLRDFLENAPSLSVEDAVDTLSQTGEALLRMVHTHDGAAAAALVLAYGTARDRKRVVKAMKGHVKNMAVNEWGHAVLCMVLAVVDDTALVAKTLLPEIKALLDEDLVDDKYVVRVLLQLLCPDTRRYFPPAIWEMMHPPERRVKGSTGKTADVEGEEEFDLDSAGGLGDDLLGDDDDDDFLTKKNNKDKKAKDKKNKDKASGAKDGSDDKGADDGKKASKAGSGEKEDEDDDEAKPQGERVLGLSKKDPYLRRKELLGAGGAAKSLAAAITAVCAARAPALVRSPHGCDLLVEVARGGQGGVLKELVPEAITEVHDALVAEAQRPADGSDAVDEDDKDDEAEEAGGSGASNYEHVLLQYYSSRALRRLALAASDEGPSGQTALALAQRLWSEVFAGQCKQWVSTHAEKVLAAVVHACPEARKAAQSELKPLVKPKSVDEWCSAFLGREHHGGEHGKQAAAGKAPSEPAAKQQQQQSQPQQGGKAEQKPGKRQAEVPPAKPAAASAGAAGGGKKAKQKK